MSRPTVIFDFDGTLALGPGPLEAYADGLAAHAGAEVAAACRRAITEFTAGGSTFLDGYDAVRVTALGHGLTEDQLSLAYLASREALGTGAAPVHPPVGLDCFMARLAQGADCVLATNAPATGIDRVLSYFGIADHLVAVHCDVGKPAGLEPILTKAMTAGPTLCVGDIWANDLEPGYRSGAATALVGVSDPAGRHPTMRAATLTDLYDDILQWAAHALASPPVPTGAAPHLRKAALTCAKH